MTIRNFPVNLPPNPTPGLRSPLFWGSFLLGTGLLVCGKNDTEYNRAIYMLAIAGTMLLTKNSVARCTSVVGGAMRLCASAAIGSLGFLAQGAAVTYSVIESTRAANALHQQQQKQVFRPG